MLPDHQRRARSAEADKSGAVVQALINFSAQRPIFLRKDFNLGRGGGPRSILVWHATAPFRSATAGPDHQEIAETGVDCPHPARAPLIIHTGRRPVQPQGGRRAGPVQADRLDPERKAALQDPMRVLAGRLRPLRCAPIWPKSGRTDGTAVLLRPTPVEAVAAVAAAGARMPRKSTLFTPKPASGLVMRRFADQP